MATSAKLDVRVAGLSAPAARLWNMEFSLRAVFSILLSLMLAVAVHISGFLSGQMLIVFRRDRMEWPEWSSLLLPWAARHEALLILAAVLSVWLPWLMGRIRRAPAGLFLVAQLSVALIWMTWFLVVFLASGVVAAY